jgi:hypothetical protein
MINQLSSIPVKTGSLPTINKALLQARHIQSHVKQSIPRSILPGHVELWSPHTSGPYLVPVTRWIE